MAVSDWRGAFLDALGRTGNAAAAARVAGVNRSTADRARKRDAGFAEAWAQALREAGSRVRAGQVGVLRGSSAGSGQGPSTGPGQAGAALVFRASRAAGPQLVAASGKRWTPAAEARFFSTLEATGSIRLACRAAGFSRRALFARKAADAEFAGRWRVAIGRGRETLHLLVVTAGAAALMGADPEADDGDGGDASDALALTGAEAISVLRFGDDGTGRHRGRPPRGVPHEARVRDLAEVKDGIMRKLDAIRAHDARRSEAEARA